MKLQPIALAYALLAGCHAAPPPLPAPPAPALQPCPTVPAPPPAPPAPPPSLKRPWQRITEVPIIPGEAVGPIRIGMRRDEVEALGVLQQHPRYELETIPYRVIYDDADRVKIVLISLLSAPADVRIDRVTLPRGTRFLEAHKLLGDCTKPDIGFGGGAYTCHGGKIQVSGGSGSPYELWIGTSAPQ